MAEPSKISIVRMDGATWNVLDRWMSDGSLPNLARLCKNGSWGRLGSTVLYLVGLPIPPDMGGRVLTEVVAPGCLGDRPIRN